MNKVPSIDYGSLVKALRKDGWVVVNSIFPKYVIGNITLHKQENDEFLKLVIPAVGSRYVREWDRGSSKQKSDVQEVHRIERTPKPIKKTTLQHILKHARLDMDRFVELL